MDDKLRRLLTQLDEAIHRSRADDHIDEDERAELRTLIDRVEEVLDEPGGEHDGVVDHLEGAAVRFEGRHPTVAAIIRSAVDTLTGYGI